MPEDDSMLGQNLVDVRNEERMARHGRTLQGLAQQAAMCTEDNHCRAPADEHFAGCPVEQRLRTEFGF